MMRILLGLLICCTSLWAADDLDKNPASADPRAVEQFIKGNTAAEQGNPYQAIFFFEEAIRFDPGSPFLYVALAEQYLVLAQENNSSEALTRAETALANAMELDGSHEPALQLKSRLLAAQGDTAGALALLRRLLNDHPTSRDYRAEMLALCLTTGDFDIVDSLYAVEQALNPERDLDLTKRIVAIYLMTGQSARSIPYMQELLAADTTDAPVTYTLATLYLQTEDTTKAAFYAERAIGLDSTDARFWYLKLVMVFDQDRFDEVLGIASRARAAAGEDAKTANLEGLSFMRLADSTRAVERFTRALELDSTLYPAAGSLGLLYEAQNELDKAVFHYEWAIRLSDSAAIYMNNLSYSFAVRGIELEHAMELVDAALDKEPENPSFLDTKGWIYYKLGDHRQALQWIKRALKHEQSAPLHEHVGDIYTAMNKPSQARASFERALELDPRSESVRAKLGQ